MGGFKVRSAPTGIELGPKAFQNRAPLAASRAESTRLEQFPSNYRRCTPLALSEFGELRPSPEQAHQLPGRLRVFDLPESMISPRANLARGRGVLVMNRPLWLSLGVVVVGIAVIVAVIALNGPTLGRVTFRETGLPAGQRWSVTIANATYSSSNDTISIRLSPSTYAFNASLANSTDYLPFPASGRIVVSASGTLIPISFVPSKANVTMKETGLPKGVWWIVGEGSTHYASNATTMNITEHDGHHLLRVLVALNFSTPFWNHNNYV